MPDFETFSKSLVPLKREPYVTLQRRGTISLNRAAFAALNSPDAVSLLFDSCERIIGLRAVDQQSPDAHFVRRSTSAPSGPFVVSAMAFFKFYDIQLPSSRRWQAHMDGDVLCVRLNENSVPARSGRQAG